MKILVVDDSRAMHRIVSRTIRQAGYEGHDIIEAETGRGHGPGSGSVRLLREPVAVITPEHQRDFMIKLDAFGDALKAAMQTCSRQLGASFEPVGTPGTPDCEKVSFGSTIALTTEVGSGWNQADGIVVHVILIWQEGAK